MIIGNGLIADGFSNFEKEGKANFSDLLIFASGVSNSKENNVDNFNREKKLLENNLKEHINKKFIYFSSILVDETDNPYYRHKKEMEEMVINGSNDYIVFRIPQIIGNKGNKNNLSNFFKNAIKNDNSIIILNNDIDRALIDINDLVKIFVQCMFMRNAIIYLSHIEKLKLINIIIHIGETMGKTKTDIDKLIKIETNIGKYNWNVDNSEIVNIAIDRLGLNKEGYTKKIIEKYIS